jgi:hypothetical protein
MFPRTNFFFKKGCQAEDTHLECRLGNGEEKQNNNVDQIQNFTKVTKKQPTLEKKKKNTQKNELRNK